LFVVSATADLSFVQGYLLPEVNVVPERTRLVSELPLGGSQVEAIVAAIHASRLSVVVLSPAYLADRWAAFGEQLATFKSIDDGQDPRVVPLLLIDCEVPLSLAAKVRLDFRDRTHWRDEAARLRRALQMPEPLDAPVECPYPGMRAFTQGDSGLFFGRQREVDALSAQLERGERELYVIGPSGSGKSSLLRAGLWPLLARDPTAVLTWMRPGELPASRLLEVLARNSAGAERGGSITSTVDRALAAQADATRLVLCIDQLEELFTLAEVDQRRAFIEQLRGLRADGRCAVLLALRADFYGALMESALWAEYDGRLPQLHVAPLSAAALRAAIVEPARVRGVYLDERLCDRLLRDAEGEPGVLPLLQETLRWLWQSRRRRLLSVADYEALGEGSRSGLAVALARRADACMLSLAPARRAIARRVLLRLVSFGDGRADTRRQLTASALRSDHDDPHAFAAVLNALLADRLITSGASTTGEGVLFDLSHEALISAWPELAEWVRSQRAAEQQRRVLEQKAGEWAARRDRRAGLLDAFELAEAEQWQRDAGALLGVSEHLPALIATSRRALDQNKRLKRLAVCSLVVLCLALAGLAFETAHLARRAVSESDKARSLLAGRYREEGRQRVIDASPLQALPLLAAARELQGDSTELTRLLALATSQVPERTLSHPESVNGLGFSSDGTRLLSFSGDAVHVWDVASGERLLSAVTHPGPVRSAVWNHAGQQIASGTISGPIRVWSAANAAVTAEIPLEASAYRMPFLHALHFSPDDTRLLTVATHGLQVWDLATQQPSTPLLPPTAGLDRSVTFATGDFSPDGRYIVSAYGGQCSVWTAEGGELVASLGGDGIVSAAFSSDGERILVTNQAGAARLWSMQTQRFSTSWFAPDDPQTDLTQLVPAVFSLDGMRVLLPGRSTLTVVDAAKPRLLFAPLGLPSDVEDVVFSPDGSKLLTRSKQRAYVWNALRGDRWMLPLESARQLRAAVFSPDGRYVATASEDRSVRLWPIPGADTWGKSVFLGAPPEAATNDFEDLLSSDKGDPAAAERMRQRAFRDTYASGKDGLVYDATGTRLIVAVSNSARVWSANSGTPHSPALPHTSLITGVDSSLDARRLVTAAQDGHVRVWDAATGEMHEALPAHDGAALGVRVAPDGSRLLSFGDDRLLRIWSSSALRDPWTMRVHAQVVAAAFHPDGRQCVVAEHSGAISLVDVERHSQQSLPGAPSSPLSALAFNRAGTALAVAGGSGSATLWTFPARKSTNLSHQTQHDLTSVAFSGDGKRLIVASSDGSARIWDVESATPVGPDLEDVSGLRTAILDYAGTHAVTLNREGTARLWNVRAGSGSWSRPLPSHEPVRAVRFSPDGQSIAALTDGYLRMWRSDAPPAASLQLPAAGDVVVAWRADGQRVLTAGRVADPRATDPGVSGARVWDPVTGRGATPVMPHGPGLGMAAFSPDGRYVVTVGGEVARVWDATTGQLILPALAHDRGPRTHPYENTVVHAAWSPDSKRLITSGRDSASRIWAVPSGTLVCEPLRHPGEVRRAQFSPTLDRVLTLGDDAEIRIWDAQTGGQLGQPLHHEAPSAALWSPDGKHIITLGGDHYARVWDVATRSQARFLLEHSQSLVSAAYSADGTRIVTSGHDNQVRVWSSRTGELLSPPLELEEEVADAQFSPDASVVITISERFTTQRWDATTGRPLTPRLEVPMSALLVGFDWADARWLSPDAQRVLSVERQSVAITTMTSGELSGPALQQLVACNPFRLVHGNVVENMHPAATCR
jgi:WD40 repeat protein